MTAEIKKIKRRAIRIVGKAVVVQETCWWNSDCLFCTRTVIQHLEQKSEKSVNNAKKADLDY
jgi:methionine synthase II (cobalamin-independent)